jgi:hypothetical protein
MRRLGDKRQGFFPVAGKAATLCPPSAIQTHNGILGYPTPAVCAEYPGTEVPIHGLVHSAVLYIVMHGECSYGGLMHRLCNLVQYNCIPYRTPAVQS